MSAEPATVAFQGEHGAYSEQAVRQHFGVEIVTLPVRAFVDIIEPLKSGRADYGMLPVENSLAGTVLPAYDLLANTDLHVRAEVVLRVEHCLMAPPGTLLADVRRVRSHQQALMQCERSLRRLRLEAVDYYDTAGAARDLAADPQPGTAAIASELAAETYGLDILARHLEDEDGNFTRFFVLGREHPARRDPSKTSVILTTRHVPGALVGVLQELARRDINLTKIESRPLRNRPWHYLFYVDFEGHVDDEPVREALRGILMRTSFLKVLGSYPAAGPEADQPVRDTDA